MDKLAFLKEKGIDIDAGFSYLGDETTYNEMLLEFKNGFINQMNEIKNAFEKKDYANYTILVHALKSNCRTFGINSLADLAYDHEMKSKEQDYNYVINHINELFIKANEIYQILDNYFKM